VLCLSQTHSSGTSLSEQWSSFPRHEDYPNNFLWVSTSIIGPFIGKIGNDTAFWNLNENEVSISTQTKPGMPLYNTFVQVVLYGGGIVFNFVRVVFSADGPGPGPGPDSLVASPDGLIASPDGLVAGPDAGPDKS
jgi:hypothetical protein